MLGTGNVIRRIGTRMMAAVISNPTGRMPRAIEDSQEDQYLFDDPVYLEGAMGKHAVVTHRGPKTSQRDEKNGYAKRSQAGKWKKNDADGGKEMYQNEVQQNSSFSSRGLPNRHFPRSNYVTIRCLHFA